MHYSRHIVQEQVSLNSHQLKRKATLDSLQQKSLDSFSEEEEEEEASLHRLV